MIEKNIAEDFYEIWNLPPCIGAIDGKHVKIKGPINSGSFYDNYKGFFSIILIAICEGWYAFSFVDIGQYGLNNDSGAFCKSAIGKLFFNKKMNLSNPKYIENSYALCQISYYLVGGDAFPLQQWLMKPYPGQGIKKNQATF